MKWKPVPFVGDTPEEQLHSAVFQAIGSASMCWEHVEDAGVFNDTLAAAIGEGLLAWFKEQGFGWVPWATHIDDGPDYGMVAR